MREFEAIADMAKRRHLSQASAVHVVIGDQLGEFHSRHYPDRDPIRVRERQQRVDSFC